MSCWDVAAVATAIKQLIAVKSRAVPVTPVAVPAILAVAAAILAAALKILAAVPMPAVASAANAKGC
jgi:hypothetical protein